MYPVYVKELYEGREPFKIVGIRQNQVELEGDYSGGTHNSVGVQWFNKDEVFVVKSICDEQLKPNGVKFIIFIVAVEEVLLINIFLGIICSGLFKKVIFVIT
jgi:hypothetical protein